ncbi:TPA: hypothetical protein SMW50_006246 [Pseudomonas aeruginosa]|nr:hypothetical protein [Pseudomonas aeruginosa]EIU2864191.1 hypothetical protein [Pseudomonas aeruginosa]MBH4415201.1 hypothetical protein [Pseudomonas aeruginosa]HEJ2342300.1 hypothetical protein [Pseudomonas aeruginosa]HEK3717339.1 hypothetical protein [Pseudomonas aeruginosa]
MNTQSRVSSFDSWSSELASGYTVASIQTTPADFVGELVERIKFSARNLKLATGLKQAEALETISSALAFRNWHELNSHLARATSRQHVALGDEWVLRLQPALVLTLRTNPEVPLKPKQITGLESFATELAKVSGYQAGFILDAVVAKLCSGLSWNQVKARTLLDAQTPLYRFIVDEKYPEDSRFVASDACIALSDRMFGMFPTHGVLNEMQRARVCQWIRKTLEKQPAFLEGGVQLAELLDDVGDPDAATIVSRYLAAFEALVPKDFKGPIRWAWHQNRLYHRLMFLRLQMLHRNAETKTEMKRAVALARRMYRLNPNDNLGVRYLLPLLLLQVGEYRSAERASWKIKTEGTGDALLVQAFCSFAVGDLDLFRDQLVGALFHIPAWRTLLLDDQATLPDGDTGYRGLVPDMNLLCSYAWPTYQMVSNLEQACRTLMNKPMVIEAEAELRELWYNLPSRPGEERSRALAKYDQRKRAWKAAIAQSVTVLSLI